MKRLLLGLVALVVVCLTAGRARADLTYGPSAAIEDAVIYSESSTLNGGAAQHLLTGRIGPDTVNADSCETAGGLGGNICGQTRRSFIRFDLGSIPTGSTIVTASVTLYLALGSGELANTLRSTSLYRVTESWVEGTGAGASQGVSAVGSDSGDGVTWTYRNRATLLGWSCSGGCVNAASATVSVSNTLSLTPPDPYVWSGSGMVADVQSWVNSPSTNFGWQIRGDESTTTTNRRFWSRFEGTYYPRLTVTYKLPLGQSCSLASDCTSNFCTNGVCCFTSSCGVANECQTSNPVCLGGSCSNPAKANGTLCTADSNPCSRDVCTSGACTHNLPELNTTLCRGSAGVCDVAENCNGSTTTCPTNAFLSGNTCRASAGGCDVVEACNGSSATCPADVFAATGTLCRGTAGPCDVAETCAGGTSSCPTDAFLSTATICRGSAGVCDVAENCTGGSATCPTNIFASSATLCRGSAGICDVAENCTGGAATCPANVFVSSATVCRGSAGICDVAENCTGGSATCPVDVFASTATVCRASGGVCDVADNCTGSGAACPTDAKQPPATGCSPDTNPCTLDRCDGVGNACTHPAGNGGTQCSAPSCTSGIATLAAFCDGSSTTCPTATTVDCAPNSCSGNTCSGGCTVDGDCALTAFCLAGVCQPKKGNGLSCGGNNHCTSTFCVDGVCCENACAGGTTDCQACNNATQLGLCRPRANGAVCRVAAGECDQDDTCNGTATTCTDVKKANLTGCTPDSNDCTNDTCNGSSNLCQHPFKPALAACTTDSNPCTVDQCDGAGLCTHPAGNAGAQCRAANGEACDVADTCDGATTGCVDNKRAPATPCTDDGNECTNDQCDGTSDLCQHPDKTLDTPCSTDNNACTRDVCNTGACTHPAGNAGAVCRSSAGVCDVQETCTGLSTACPVNAFQPATLQCRAASCGSGIATFAANCTGSTATCPAISTQACSPFICSGTTCSTSCASDTGCATTAWCNGNVCDPKESDGAPCTAANQCLSGQCVDGVCCNRACAGQCEACDVAGAVGRCTNVIGDPHGSRPVCASDGTACAGFCNGTLNTACFLPGNTTECRPPSCDSGVATLRAVCTGTGSCPAVTTQDCGQFVCDVDRCFGNCTADIQCVATSYCSGGVCVPKLGLGTTCNTDNQCTSTRCVDGVCCNDRCLGQCEACNVGGSLGTCTAVSGTPHAPRLPCVTDGSLCGGTCDGSVRTSCTYPGAGTSCRDASCANDQAVLQAFCDGVGSCPAEFRQSCAPYTCAGTTCAGDCASNRDCSSTEFCSANVCAPKRNNGETCPDGNACKSGICVDGMCCDSPCTGQCEACDVTGSLGACTAVVGAPHGTRPACTTDSSACGGTCNGSLRTACGYPAAETSCRAASCAANVATMAATCNGSGRCPAPQQVSCGTLGCSGTRCGGNCTTDANCATDQFCLAGICKPLLIIGQPCSSGAQCFTGFCVDGVCCDRACTGQCEACDIVTRPGLCTAVTSGLPHGGRASCAGVGPCAAQCTADSATQCTFPNSSTICGGGACSGQAAIEPPLCNGAGSCLPPTTRVCNPYVCSGDVCLTTCSGDADCATGHVCSSGSCVPAPPDAGSEGGVDAGADAGDASAAGSGGTGTGATGGTGASGGSGGSGASAAAAGSDTDAGDAGPKRPGAAVEDDGGCGCRVAAPERDGSRGLALLAGIALLAAARRRRVTPSR